MSKKFFPIENLTIEGDRYELLPFRFERLPSNEVLITNYVGEYLLISSDELELLVNHQLDSSHQIFPDLRSKHFIKLPQETLPLELLALKKRSRLSSLSNFTNLHIFVLTLRCDHSCQYCQVSRQSENKVQYDMSKETADKALDVAFMTPNGALKIEFQGGEPLLNFDLLKHIVLSAKERNRVAQKDLQFVIATTMSLLDDSILDFIHEHEILISSSLDGPEELHNHNRPRKEKNSYEAFVEGLNKARDKIGFGNVSALMTPSLSPSANLDLKQIIDEYIKLDFEGIFLRSISPYGFAVKSKNYRLNTIDKWLDAYEDALQYILQINKEGTRFVEYYASLFLKKMLTSKEPGFVDLMTPSGIGISAVVFNYDGDVYASDESRMLKEMGDETFKIGNVHTSSYKDIFTNDVLLTALDESFSYSNPMCNECAFEPWCGSDPIYHHSIFNDFVGRKPESAFCRKTKGVSTTILNLLKDDENKRIMMEWIQ